MHTWNPVTSLSSGVDQATSNPSEPTFRVNLYIEYTYTLTGVNLYIEYVLKHWQGSTCAEGTLVNWQSTNLRQGIVMKTSFSTRVSQMGTGFRQFCGYQYFFMKHFLFSMFIYSILSNLLNQNLHKFLDPKIETEFCSTILFKISGSGVNRYKESTFTQWHRSICK